MGAEQSVQASGRVVCQGAAFVSDGKSIKQVVDTKKDVTYTNHDPSTLSVMMNRDVRSAVDQFDTALSCATELGQCTQSGKTVTDK